MKAAGPALGPQPSFGPDPAAAARHGGGSIGVGGAVNHRVVVFNRCCAVLAVHLAVDAFVDLRPGTGPADHLVSGTVPLVCLAALVWMFGRARIGLGATLAILLGLASVAAGIGAPVSALVVDGDVTLSTLTGLVGTAAGAVLVGLGSIMLFRSRRLGGSRLGRWSRRLARGGLGLMLLVVVVQPVAFGYVTANRSSGFAVDVAELGPDHEPVALRTADGLTLAAAYRPSDNGAAIIVFPGRAVDHEQLLAANGYGVLVLEPRGHHRSEGDPNLLGWSGEEDLRAAVRYLRSRPDVVDGRIGGLGLSVGAELMLQTAADLPALRAVVAEGAGTRWVAEDLTRAADIPLLPGSAIATLATAVFADSAPPAPLADLMSRIAPRPILLIWTPQGDGGEHHNPRYHQQAREPKAIWEIPDSAHIGGLAARPDEYAERVIGFFDHALQVSSEPGDE